MKSGLRRERRGDGVGQKSFILHYDKRSMFDALIESNADGKDSYENIGRLFMALFDYAEKGETSIVLNQATNVAFAVMCSQIDADAKQYADKCAKNRINISKRWQHNNTTEYNGIQSYTKHTDTDTDTDTHTHTDNIKDIVPPQAERTPRSNTIDYESFKDTYNKLCSRLPKINVLSDNRKKAIKAFLKQLEFSDFENACKKANESGFLTGKNDRGWMASFDFIIKTDKALNIIEGKYDGKNAVVNAEHDVNLDDLF